MMIVDVWAQITTERMAKRPWLEPLMRWTAGSGEHLLSSPEITLAAMDEGGVDIAFLSAWHGPEGDLISNEEVARQIDAAPTRFRGLASVDLHNPMAGVREIRRWVDGKALRWRACRALALGFATEQSALLPDLRSLCGRGRAILHTDRPHWTTHTNPHIE